MTHHQSNSEQRSEQGGGPSIPASTAAGAGDGVAAVPRRGEVGYRDPRHRLRRGGAGVARKLPSAAVVTGLVVRVAGIVPVRIDLTHAGTVEQQLGLSTGKVLVFMRSGITARAIADGWAAAAVQARPLRPAITGQRRLPVGACPVTAMVELGGAPEVTATFEPARAGGASPALLRVRIGVLMWEVCDATAYVSLGRAWRHAARLLGDNPADD